MFFVLRFLFVFKLDFILLPAVLPALLCKECAHRFGAVAPFYLDKIPCSTHLFLCGGILALIRDDE